MQARPFKISLAIVCALVAAQPLRAAEVKPLVIAVQPTSTPEQLSGQAAELDAFLEQQLGRAVELRFPTSYAGVIEALRFGHAQAAFMGAWPAALAKQHAGAEVVLAEVRDVTIGENKQEAPFYFSYWVVLKDSPYQSLGKLRGKKAAFTSQISSSGYVAPLAKLVELGLLAKPELGVADANQFFSEVVFAGGYAQAWEALKAGQVDASVIAGDVPEALYKEVLSGTRILAEQGPIPSHAVVVSKDLATEERENLVQALMALNHPAHRGLMRKFISGIFVRFEPATTDGHLGPFDRMLQLTGADLAMER